MRPVALLVLSACACAAHLERPAVELRSAELEGFDAEGATVLCRLEVSNPNPVELSVARLSWQLSLQGKPLAEGSLPDGARLPARGRTALALPARIRYRDVPEVLKVVLSGEELTYELKGVAGVSGPVGVFDLPFAHSGKLGPP